MHKRRKQTILIISTGLVILLSVLLLLGRKSSTYRRSSVDFAVSDTASVQWIFLADREGCQVLLQRKSESQWELNRKETALKENMDDLLSVIQNITVKAPVGTAATENVTKWLATGATKVQIAYLGHRINLGRLHLWKCERTKTFYIGSPTPDNMGNYAIMEKSRQPFVVYVPGFRGFISPYFSAIESDWKSHEILNLRISEIAEITLKDVENPESSLQIRRHGEKHFDLADLSSGQLLPAYDTLKLYDHLSSYRKLNFEFFAAGITPEKRDSILSVKFKELTVKDMEGKTVKISMYHILNEFNTEEYDYNEDFMDVYNRDKFYITLNDNTKDFYICQYFVFDRIIQPLEYYYPGNETIAIHK